MISKRDKTGFKEAAQHENMGSVRYGIQFFRNWILERLASNFPVPSWRAIFHRMRGVKIGQNVYVGYDVIFDRIHPSAITIEDYAEIGDRTIISAHTRGSMAMRDAYSRKVDPVIVEYGAWIAPSCIILPGVRIGKLAVVGTGAVVTKDVPPRTVVAGVPARVIKHLGE